VDSGNWFKGYQYRYKILNVIIHYFDSLYYSWKGINISSNLRWLYFPHKPMWVSQKFAMAYGTSEEEIQKRLE